MKTRLAVLLAAVLLLAGPIWAQDDDPIQKYEVFAGYSYLRSDLGTGHGDLAGGALLSGAYRFNRHLAAVGEWSTHHDTFNLTNVDSNLFLFGPRVYLPPVSRFNPFAHVLFGVHHTQVGFPPFSRFSVAGRQGDDDTGFALAVGGGVDTKVHKNIAIRILQADYLPTDLNLPTRSGRANQFTDNIRLSSGVVFRWGER